MAKTTPINTSNPAGDSDRRDGDDYIRALAAAVIEYLQVDHYTGDTNPYNEDDAGEHAKITLRQSAAAPSNDTDKGFVYTKEGDSGTTELFYKDEAGNEIQLTKGGRLYIEDAYISDGGLIAPKTDDAADDDSMAIAGGGAAGVTRGGTIQLYGNEHSTNPGKVVITTGYSAATAKAVLDVQSCKITNVVDPENAQEAATKNYIDTRIGDGSFDPTSLSFSSNPAEQSVTFPNGLIMKSGYAAYANPSVITFGTAFPNAVLSVVVSGVHTAQVTCNAITSQLATTGFTIRDGDSKTGHYWIAWGR